MALVKVADQSIDMEGAAHFFGPDRSVSESSSEGSSMASSTALSKSPIGFWYVRQGSDWPQTKQPLSRASRDYVLGLDIEADVRMLHERLNMQNDVLDYFCSSRLILKAGVRAGLTL